MRIVREWISDIYAKSGWQAALIVVVVLALLVLIAVKATGIDLGVLSAWLEGI